MVALGANGAGRRMCQAGISFDGFVKDLDVPTCLIECRDAVVGELKVTAGGDQTAGQSQSGAVEIDAGLMIQAGIEDRLSDRHSSRRGYRQPLQRPVYPPSHRVERYRRQS